MINAHGSPWHPGGVPWRPQQAALYPQSLGSWKGPVVHQILLHPDN